MFTDSSTVIHHMIQDIHSLYGNYLLVAIMTLFLAIATYTDVKSFKIPNKLNLVFGILAIVVMPFMNDSTSDILFKILGAIFGFLVLFIPAMIKAQPMGGDIKAITVIGLYLGISIMPVFIFLSCVFGMTYLYIRYIGKKPVWMMPFAPCFFVAHITIFIFSFFIT